MTELPVEVAGCGEEQSENRGGKSFHVDMSRDELQPAGEDGGTDASTDTFQTHPNVALDMHTRTCW